MPIHTAVTVRNLSQTEFDERDATVMRCAYAAQNELGRLCDERVYENDLARRLKAEGFSSVHTQVPLTVSHDGFNKTYRLDLVADDAVYELKTTSGFVPEHDTQVLHYAMLLNVNHAKLLNFRPAKIQGRLRFSALLAPKRFNIQIAEHGWISLSPQCDALKARVGALLRDWGAGLELPLYEEALVHFCGGEAKCVRRIPVALEEVELGSHAVALHADGLSFLVTAFTSEIEAQETHIRRLLTLKRLHAIQWINLNHTTVQLETVQAG